MQKLLLFLSLAGKAFAFVGALNVLPGVPPHIAILIFFAASVLKDVCNRFTEFIQDNYISTTADVLKKSGLPLLVACLCFTSLFLAGCAGGAVPPEQFTASAVPTPSAADQKTAQTLANLDTSTFLLGEETGAATATSVGMYIGIKQATTMQSDGQLLNGAGLTLEAFTAGSLPTSSPVSEIVGGLKLKSSTQQSAVNLANLSSSLNGLISSGYNWIVSAAGSTMNPDLKAYALKVALDNVHAVGKGLVDATAQYGSVTTPLAAAPPLTFRMPAHVAASTALALNL